MTPRHFVPQIVSRVAKTAAIAALALGVGTPMLMPSPALAAPAGYLPLEAPGVFGPDLVPAFSTGGKAKGGERAAFLAGARNEGSSTARGVRMVVAVPEMTSITVNSGQFACSRAQTIITCTLPELPSGESRAIEVSGLMPQTSGTYSVVVRLDPNDTVDEVIESNNDGVFRLASY